jgi:hypothetical protein
MSSRSTPCDKPRTPGITRIIPEDDHSIRIEFANGEWRRFDASPLLDKGIFTELRNLSYFRQAQIIFGGVSWPNEQDLSADTLYLRSTPITPDIGEVKRT